MATKKKSRSKPVAKKSAGTKRTAKAAGKPAARPRKAPMGGGPVTLDEARALARARQPKRALRRALAGPPATAATVGEERERLEQQHRAERERRIREYRDTMEIMKRRGARRAAPKGAAKEAKGPAKGRRRAPGAPAAGFQPLQVFAEGDSWFDYPPFLFKGGIIPRLESRLGVPILNLAKAGDEVRFMLGVEQRKRLAECLTDGCPAGGPWDVLLFSGGGNDIVDNPMALWVRDWDPTVPPATLINQPRFDAALALVRAGYEDLITLRDRLSPNTHLVFHGYDFAIPDGRGICHLGPWLKPTFDLRGFPTRAAAFAVVQAMLKQFAAMLAALAAHPKVTFINGQGTLAQNPGAWHNELHPDRDGFEKFAELFYQQLRPLFPGRVA
jgi:hypothetical protein